MQLLASNLETNEQFHHMKGLILSSFLSFADFLFVKHQKNERQNVRFRPKSRFCLKNEDAETFQI